MVRYSIITEATTRPRRILVIRNDKLGDFMLAWPAYACLKQYWPDATVYALVPPYTEEMARICPWIDEVIIDSGENAWQLGKKLSAARLDAMLTLYSTGRTALAGAIARIPYRLGPATKISQFFHNHRLTQRRSRSEKPEYAYNIDLAYRLLNDLHGDMLTTTSSDSDDDYLPPVLTRPLLEFNKEESSALRQDLCSKHQLDCDTKLVFIHPGSGGSANNLLTEQYVTLANSLRSSHPLTCVITAGPGEESVAEEIASAITFHTAITLPPQGELPILARYLQLADLFISCSTGPLHISGALNRPTAAFYPRHRSGSPLRWQTLNSPKKRLVFAPPDGTDEKNVSAIDIQMAADRINQQLLTN